MYRSIKAADDGSKRSNIGNALVSISNAIDAIHDCESFASEAIGNDHEREFLSEICGTAINSIMAINNYLNNYRSR